MDKINLVAILVSITLVFSIANAYANYNLSNRIDAINNTNNILLNKLENNTQPQATPAPVLRLNVSADDDPVKGSNDAPVTIIEFSDFECPFCERFYTQTLPLIDSDYIQTGKVKFVYRDFPLSFHRNATKAAEAADCANEQGKFWEYHDKIYENQNDIGIASLKQYAVDLGLDAQAFNTCLDSGKMTQEVQKDAQDGRAYGVQGTPTFFINGIRLVGAQPYENFQQVIDQELKT